jgi:hypothetical protein
VLNPERRNTSTTRGDLVAAALLTTGVLVIAALLWHYGDANATTSRTAASTPPPLASATALPPSLAQVWQAPSAATPAPVVAGGSIVTGNGSEVAGRDPFTGEVRWRYARDIPLCTVVPAVPAGDIGGFSNALAAYRKHPDFCSEVVMLAGGTGSRVAQRNGDAEAGARVLTDGSHVTAAGTQYLETWRSDLVRTTQYGRVQAPLNPGKQPRSGCEYGSVAVASNLIALIERCPSEDSDRLTVLKANPANAEQPEVNFSVQIGARGGRVVAVSTDRVAVLLPDPARLVSLDKAGNQVASNQLDITVPTNSGKVEPPATTVTPAAVYWFTGSSTVALNPSDLIPRWTVPGTLGPGTLLAGRLLMPMPGELAVLDAATGERIGGTPVDRGSYRGTVQLATAGSVVLEQRTTHLVALR